MAEEDSPFVISVSRLTKVEILDVVKPFCSIPRSVGRRKKEMIEYILRVAPIEVLQILERLSSLPRLYGRKRSLDFLDEQEDESFDHCRKKRRIDVQEEDVFSSKFLNLPSEDEVKDCYRAFFEATSNNGLQMFICAVCARESDIVNGETMESCKCISLLDIRHRERLRPIECVFFCCRIWVWINGH